MGVDHVARKAPSFDIWGCRGTRNLDPGFSRIGVKTSCYSLLAGPELVVFDAGKGLLMLAQALQREERFAGVERVHLLLSHGHMDHWEGLKDAVWFWRRHRPLEVTLLAAREALEVVRSAFAHPSFVPLEMLAAFAGITFREEALAPGDRRMLGPLRLSTVLLNHFIGEGEARRRVVTLGFRVEAEGGPSVSYACDHEPEGGEGLGVPPLVLGTSLVVLDSYFGAIREQGFGHGSMELASRVARAHPHTLVLTGHLGPQFTDETIIETVLRHAAGLETCRIPREGDTWTWDETSARFVAPPPLRLPCGASPADPQPRAGAAAPTGDLGEPLRGQPEAAPRVRHLEAQLELRDSFIRRTFGRHLTDDAMARLLQPPEGLRVDGEKRVVTILMANLRGFTALTHSLAPELVMRVVNSYLGAMTEIVNRHHGTVDELVGDAILALFGAPTAGPDDALRAVRCAVEMQVAMAGVNECNAAAGLPQVEMGIGLNTGEVVAGCIGSEARTRYGIVGSHVNLADRVESFTVGGQVLITESTRAAAGPAVLVGTRMAVNAKGFPDLVTVHELLGLGPPFDLRLAPAVETLTALPRPVEALCWVLAEKPVDTETFTATVVALSPHGARLLAEPRPELLTNLRIRLLGEVDPDASVLYGKVSALDADSPRGFRVRFTSVRPETTARLKAWRETAPGG